MKILFTIALLFVTTAVFCHDRGDLEYAIVFGACFEKSVISLKVNNKPVFDKYRLGFEKLGNLSLKQTAKGINVYYNGKEKYHSKIKVDHIVNLAVTVNGIANNFTIDLRKGNILLLDSCNDNQPTASKKLSIEQRQEAVILM